MENSQTLVLIDLFKMGGLFMWPLLVFSVATISIAVERFIYLMSHNLKMDMLFHNVIAFIREKNTEGAKSYLRNKIKKFTGARILFSLMNNCDKSEHLMEKAAETEAQKCIFEMESGFDFLSALGSLAPLTGFLGTVSGMIGAFKSIAEATEVNAQIVANGIYEALITTVFGLIIAIIAMVANSLLTHTVDKFTANVENSCSQIIMEIARSGD
jgi:biopolymer transport protein ExbB